VLNPPPEMAMLDTPNSLFSPASLQAFMPIDLLTPPKPPFMTLTSSLPVFSVSAQSLPAPISATATTTMLQSYREILKTQNLILFSLIRTKSCCVCGQNAVQKVTQKWRVQIFANRQVWVPKDCLFCFAHNETAEIPPSTPTRRELIQVTELLDIFTDELNTGFKRNGFSFDSLCGDRNFRALTGISQTEFEDLLKSVTIRPKLWGRRDALGIALMKLRTGLSHSELAAIFDVSKRAVQHRFKATLLVLTKPNGFTSQNVGPSHVTRETIIEHHTTAIAKELFGADKLILVADSSDFPIEKSKNFELQRKSYGLKKHCNVLRMMLVTSTNGYILSATGPYFADGANNDAGIFKYEMRGGMQGHMKEGDIWIADRGFRDAKRRAHQQGTEIHTPAFLHKASAFTTKQANDTRMLTKLRWVVEAGHRRLKQFKLIGNRLHNTQIQCMDMYCTVIAALCNKYRKPLKCDSPADAQLAKLMLERREMSNILSNQIARGMLKDGWETVEYMDIDFPIFSESEIENQVTLGCYQVELAPRYLEDKVGERGVLDGICRRKDNKGRNEWFRVQLRSRHSKRTRYVVHVELTLSLTDWQPQKIITGWCCDCCNGKRRNGCCAHVAAIIWYLGRLDKAEKLKCSSQMWRCIIDAGIDADVQIDDNERAGSETEVDDHSDSESTDEIEVGGSEIQTTQTTTMLTHMPAFTPQELHIIIEVPTIDTVRTLSQKRSRDEEFGLDTHTLDDHIPPPGPPIFYLSDSGDDNQPSSSQIPAKRLAEPHRYIAEWIAVKRSIPATNISWQELVSGGQLSVVQVHFIDKLRKCLIDIQGESSLNSELLHSPQLGTLDFYSLIMSPEILDVNSINDLWVRDGPINLFATKLNELYPHTYTFNSHLLNKMAETNEKNQPNPALIARWAPRSLSESLQHIFIPFNQNENHWAVVHIDLKAETMSVLDGLGTVSNVPDFCEALKIQLEERSIMVIRSLIEWKPKNGFKSLTIRNEKSLTQTDGFNCGPLMLMNIEVLANGWQEKHINVTREMLQQYRYRMCLAMLQGRLCA
jgi:hypothetical protein